MSDSIFNQSNEESIFQSAPPKDDLIRIAAAKKRDAAFSAYAYGGDHIEKAQKAYLIEQQLLESGSSADLDKIREQLLGENAELDKRQTDALLSSDKPVPELVAALKEKQLAEKPVSTEDLVVEKEKQYDSRYIPAIVAAQKFHAAGGKYFKEEVDADPLFKEAAKQLHKKIYGKEFGAKVRPSRAGPLAYNDPIEYGRDLVRSLNSPLLAANLASKIDTEDDALALLYMMTTLDTQENTFEGVMKNIGIIAADPTNLVSMGVGSLASKGISKLVSKKLISEAVGKTLTRAFISAEAGTYVATSNVQKQQVEVKAGFKKEVDKAEAAQSFAIGAAFPLALEGGAKVIALGYGKYKTKSLARTLRESSPSAGRTATKSNIEGENPLAGETPEESFLSIMPQTDDELVGAGPSIFSRYESLVDQFPAIASHYTEQELNSVKKTTVEALAKASTFGNAVVREDKSVVRLEGDKIYADIALGVDKDTGFLRISDAADIISDIKNKATVPTEVNILSRKADGSFGRLSPSEAQDVMAFEMNNNGATGEYFITVGTKNYVENIPQLAFTWTDDMLQGLKGFAARLFNYGPSRGKRFFSPHSSLANAQAFTKQILEQPIVKLRTLSPNDQVSVINKLAEDEKLGRWMLPDEATLHFGGKQDLIEAYYGFKSLSKDLHDVFDYNLTRQAQEDGFQRITFTDMSGGESSMAAKEVGPSFLEGAREVVDLVTGEPVDPRKLELGKYKIFQLYDAVRFEKGKTNIGIINAETKIGKSILSSVLKEREMYIPGVRRAVYKVIRKEDGHTFNGLPVAPSEFLGTTQGQEAITVAMANTDVDARAFIAQQQDPHLYDVITTREAGGVDTSLELGNQLNSKGVVYGSRSQGGIETIKGSGALADIVGSFEYATNKAASLMTSARAFKFQENKWLNTYTKNGASYPRDIAELEEIIGSTRIGPKQEAGSPEVIKKKADAKKAWEAIELQRSFQENLASKIIDGFAIKIDRMLTNSPILGTIIRPSARRWIGKNVAEGSPISQKLKTIAFYDQVVFSLSQIPLNATSAGAHSLFALGSHPKVFPLVLRDWAYALSGSDEVLLNQLKSTGIISSISTHDLQQYLVSTTTRTAEARNSLLDKATTYLKQAGAGVKKYTFDKPEAINRASAFITARRIYAAEQGKDVAKLTKEEIESFVVPMADTLTATMNNAGKLPLNSVPGLDLLMQYAGYSLKMSSLILSGVPGISKVPGLRDYAQKVIDPKYVRRAMLSYLAVFGAAGIGSDEMWKKIRTKYGIAPDSAADTFLRNGIFGFTLNQAASFSNKVMGDDKDVDLAWTSRLSPMNGAGLDAFIKPYDFVTQHILGDGDVLGALANFPVAGLTGQVRDAFQLSYDLTTQRSPEELTTDDKLGIVFWEMMKDSTVATKSYRKAWLAWNTGKLYDRYGRETIGGLSKAAAIAQIVGVQPAELQEKWRINKALQAPSKAMDGTDAKELAKEHYDRVHRILTMASQHGYSVEQTRTYLKAANMIFGFQFSSDQVKVEAENEYYKLVNKETGVTLTETLKYKIDKLISTSTTPEDFDKMLDSIPDSMFGAEQKETWRAAYKFNQGAISSYVEGKK